MKGFKVLVDGMHKHTGVRAIFGFAVIAESGAAAIESVYKNYDLSGIDIYTSVAQEQESLCASIGVREVI